MLLILDGTNKAGKTTIVNYILDKFKDSNFEVIKCSQPKIVDGVNTAYQEYNEILDKVEANPNKNYILDRFHFGSFVYGPIYREVEDFNLDKFVKLEERIETLKYVFLLCISSATFMKKKFKEDSEEFAKEELITKERELFIKTSRMSRLNMFHHNLPKNDIVANDKLYGIIKAYVS